MPSSERGLDSRRLKDVKPRGVRSDDGENYAYDNFKHRVNRRRLVDVQGEAETKADELALASRGKVKCVDCPAMVAFEPAFPINRCQRCAIVAGDRETAALQCR